MAKAGQGKGVRNAGSKTQRPSSPSKSPTQSKTPTGKNAPGKKNPQSQIRLRFVTSAVDMEGCPQDNKPEVGLVGRSNSGKSSLLNGIANERIAMVSSTPGKTRLLNFFDAGPRYRYVDMPGYGWPERGGSEHHGWKRMIEKYLGTRENLCGLLLLMDARRDWTEDEQLLVDWLQERGLPVAVVLTKTDKLGKNELINRIKAIKSQSNMSNFFVTSALKKTGFEELEDFVYKNWVHPKVKP